MLRSSEQDDTRKSGSGIQAWPLRRMTLSSRDIVAQARMKGRAKCERFVVNCPCTSDADQGLSVCVCVCVCREPGVRYSSSDSSKAPELPSSKPLLDHH